MTATFEEIEANARSWLAVPVFHKGRTRPGGVDCLGLIIGVGLETGALDDPDEANAEWRDYGRLPNAKRLKASMDETFTPLADEEARPGDIKGLTWGAPGLVMHLAIMGTFEGRPTIIHAYPLVKPPRVVEFSFSGEWPGRQCGHWRYPKVR